MWGIKADHVMVGQSKTSRLFWNIDTMTFNTVGYTTWHDLDFEERSASISSWINTSILVTQQNFSVLQSCPKYRREWRRIFGKFNDDRRGEFSSEWKQAKLQILGLTEFQKFLLISFTPTLCYCLVSNNLAQDLAELCGCTRYGRWVSLQNNASGLPLSTSARGQQCEYI